MKKYLRFFLMMTLCVVLGIAAQAKTVYVADGASGDGSSADAPSGSLSDAFTALGGEGGTITLVGDTTVSSTLTIPEQSGNLTLTAENGAVLNVGARIQIEKNTNSNTFTFDLPFNMTSSAFMFGGFNSIVFTKNFTVSGEAFRFYGGVLAGEAETNEACITELSYSVEVNGGTFTHFAGGNLRNGSNQFLGAIAAPITVTINGGKFGVSGDYSAALAANKSFDAFNISGMNVLADKATLNITGGTFNTPIYISGRRGAINCDASENSTTTAGNKKYYAIDGDIAVNITGGTFNGGAVAAYYVDASYTQVMRGNYTVSVTGGTFAEGTVFDATQVKAYAGETKKAAITVKDGITVFAKRFDEVEGANVTTVTCEDEPLRVAFIGDSITEGYGVNALTQSYPAQFLANAVTNNKDVIIANLGVSSGGMRPCAVRYYPAMLAYPIALGEVDADYYVFALGTNDCNFVGTSNGTLTEYYNRYKPFIKACGDLDDTEKVYVTSATLRCGTDAISPQYNMRAVALIRPMQERIANELAASEPDKYTYVDLYALTYEAAISGKLLSSDNLHPHADGYAIMGQVMYDAIFNKVYTKDSLEMTDIYVSADGEQFGEGTKDKPTSSLAVAFGKCAPNATIHIMGTYEWPVNINTPLYLESLTIVGEEDTDAVLNLTLNSDTYFSAGSKLKIDNLTIKSNSTVMFFGRYNDIEFTESFNNDCTMHFYAGYAVQQRRDVADLAKSDYYDTVESASSDSDCTVTIANGTFAALMGGNRRLAATAPYGTYSGDMTLTLGENVKVTDATNSGIVGMNYHTGKTVANINGWGDTALKDHARIGALSGVDFDLLKNKGTVTLNVGEGAASNITVTGDFNADNRFSIADVLTAIRYMLDDEVGNAETHFYGVSELDLLHIIHLLKKAVK